MRASRNGSRCPTGHEREGHVKHVRHAIEGSMSGAVPSTLVLFWSDLLVGDGELKEGVRGRGTSWKLGER